jgi:hypothetical protein
MASIFFTSAEHKARFLATIRAIDKIDHGGPSDGRFDQEYSAALYILTSSTATWEKAQSYVSRRGIDFEELLHEVDFSGAYSVLILLASNLFNSNTHIDPVEFMRLDDRNFALAMAALQVRRASLHEKDFSD